MNFGHLERSFSECAKHISWANSNGSDLFQVKEVEHHLLRAMVMQIVSQYEETVEALFVKRAEKCNDDQIHSLVSCFADRRFRSPDLGKISETLKMLSPSCRDSFRAQIETKQPEVKAAWEILMTARHAIVHKENSGAVTLTWSELEKAYRESKRVFPALANALGLNKKDLSQI